MSITELKEKAIRLVNQSGVSENYYVRYDIDKYIKTNLTDHDLSDIIDTDTVYKEVVGIIEEQLTLDITERELEHWNLLKDIMEV